MDLCDRRFQTLLKGAHLVCPWDRVRLLCGKDLPFSFVRLAARQHIKYWIQLTTDV